MVQSKVPLDPSSIPLIASARLLTHHVTSLLETHSPLFAGKGRQKPTGASSILRLLRLLRLGPSSPKLAPLRSAHERPAGGRRRLTFGDALASWSAIGAERWSIKSDPQSAGATPKATADRQTIVDLKILEPSDRHPVRPRAIEPSSHQQRNIPHAPPFPRDPLLTPISLPTDSFLCSLSPSLQDRSIHVSRFRVSFFSIAASLWRLLGVWP